MKEDREIEFHSYDAAKLAPLPNVVKYEAELNKGRLKEEVEKSKPKSKDRKR